MDVVHSYTTRARAGHYHDIIKGIIIGFDTVEIIAGYTVFYNSAAVLEFYKIIIILDLQKELHVVITCLLY